MLRRLKKCLFTTSAIISTRLQYIKIINNMNYSDFNEISKNIDDKLEKILIIVPHADDELIGCYNLIKKYGKNVSIFFCNFTGSNNELKNRQLRLEEFKNFCNNEEVIYYISTENIHLSMKEIISLVHPNIIFMPCCFDWHVEHRKVNYLLKDALNELNRNVNIGWYYISVPPFKEKVNYILEMSRKEHKEKWSKFNKYYSTQKNMPTYRYKYAEKINGNRYNIHAAEVFWIMEKKEWEFLINYIASHMEKKLNTLKEKINNLIEIRLKIDEIYSEIYNKEKNISEE